MPQAELAPLPPPPAVHPAVDAQRCAVVGARSNLHHPRRHEAHHGSRHAAVVAVPQAQCAESALAEGKHRGVGRQGQRVALPAGHLHEAHLLRRRERPRHTRGRLPARGVQGAREPARAAARGRTLAIADVPDGARGGDFGAHDVRVPVAQLPELGAPPRQKLAGAGHGRRMPLPHGHARQPARLQRVHVGRNRPRVPREVADPELPRVVLARRVGAPPPAGGQTVRGAGRDRVHAPASLERMRPRRRGLSLRALPQEPGLAASPAHYPALPLLGRHPPSRRRAGAPAAPPVPSRPRGPPPLAAALRRGAPPRHRAGPAGPPPLRRRLPPPGPPGEALPGRGS